MERTRTTGVYIDAAGCRIIDKWFKGKRIFARLGQASQEEAEAVLAKRINEIRAAKLFGESRRRTFREAALKHLMDEQARLVGRYGNEGATLDQKAQKQLDDTAWHLRLLDPFIGDLPLDEVSDDALRPFVEKRQKDGVSAKTIRLTLEKVRRILNKAARTWRENKKPWLSVQPPLITMPKGKARPPAPLSRIEERELFSRLPKHIAEMCLFKVNTGLRESEVCGLRWEWERKVNDHVIVFVIPPGFHKGGKFYRLVVLNSIARSVIDAQRGKDREWVFVSRKTKRPLTCLNNNPFQAARKAAGLDFVRVHDLKHTFGERLEAAGVPFAAKQVLLGTRTEALRLTIRRRGFSSWSRLRSAWWMCRILFRWCG